MKWLGRGASKRRHQRFVSIIWTVGSWQLKTARRRPFSRPAGKMSGTGPWPAFGIAAKAKPKGRRVFSWFHPSRSGCPAMPTRWTCGCMAIAGTGRTRRAPRRCALCSTCAIVATGRTSSWWIACAGKSGGWHTRDCQPGCSFRCRWRASKFPEAGRRSGVRFSSTRSGSTTRTCDRSNSQPVRGATLSCLGVSHPERISGRASCLSQRASKRFCRCTWAEAIVTGWNLAHLLSAIRLDTAERTARSPTPLTHEKA